MDKLCWACKNVKFDPGEQDWSDITPGCDAYLVCTKKRFPWFTLNRGQYTLSDLRRTIETAKDCPDWDPDHQ